MIRWTGSSICAISRWGSVENVLLAQISFLITFYFRYLDVLLLLPFQVMSSLMFGISRDIPCFVCPLFVIVTLVHAPRHALRHCSIEVFDSIAEQRCVCCVGDGILLTLYIINRNLSDIMKKCTIYST